MTNFTNRAGAAIVYGLIDTIQSNKEYLSEIDGAIGDGDHGINMNKGFTICKERLTADKNMSEALGMLGDILLTEIGGSMGPIYGSFFLEMSAAAEGVSEIDEQVFGKMLSAGLAGIRELVPTEVGDKTLLDTLIPAVKAFNDSIVGGSDFIAALDRTAQSAEAGKESTKDMIAKVGRASRLGERSRGVLDAGATSCWLIINSMCTTAKELLR